MGFDVGRSAAWIPFRRASGSIEWGPPCLLTDRIATDPVVAIAAPRPDLGGAVEEFLIGILSVAFVVADTAEWRRLWETPPTRTALQARLDALPPAFDLDGAGPRFMQDFSAADFAEVEPVSIEQILIDAPGGQTERLNKDLFVKRARVERLGLPAATMALLTLQTYAPAGGQGHRTSLRGGGPLTTLVDPRGGESGADAVALSLWRKLWANVATVAEWRELPGSRLTTPSDIFPWMAPTRTSSGSGSAVTPADAHPAQAYFGMPRRIRLEFAGPGRCDLTGIDCEQTVTSFRMRNYGIQYSGWKHPLSPYYRRKDTESWLPVHGQPGGLSWRDWIGLTLVQPAGSTREPARAVSRFVQQLAPHVRIAEVRLHAFGYDMDNMKARGWIASERPLFAVTDPHDRDVLADTARRLSAATDLAAAELASAGKNALFNRAEDVRGDFSQYRRRVWNETESAFFAALHRLISQRLAAEDVELIARDFLAALNTVVLGTFDDWCPIAGLAGERLPRLVRARFTLVNALRGTSTSGAKLFEALGLPAAVNAKLGRRTKKHSTRGAAA